MGVVQVPAGAREVKIYQVVGRACRKCGGPSKVDPDTGLHQLVNGKPVCADCGAMTSAQDKGLTVYWHRNPLRRLAWRLVKYPRR